MNFDSVEFLVWDECEQHMDSIVHANGNDNTVRISTPNVAWAKDLFGQNCDYKDENCPTYSALKTSVRLRNLVIFGDFQNSFRPKNEIFKIAFQARPG